MNLGSIMAGTTGSLLVGEPWYSDCPIEACCCRKKATMTFSKAGHCYVGGGRVAMPEGMSWMQDLSLANPIDHTFPGGQRVHFSEVWRGSIALNSATREVQVAYSGGDDEERLVVFLDGWGVAEFPQTYQGEWASLIKPDSRHSIDVGDPVPDVYRNARIENYRTVTGRPQVWNKACVVIVRADLWSAVHHAASRALARLQVDGLHQLTAEALEKLALDSTEHEA